jgi:mannosyltransferase OCH1-like enzyme
MKKTEREHLLNEKLYVPIVNPTITPLVIQIWFGSMPSGYKQFMFESVKKQTEEAGWHYKLLTSKDFTQHNFPFVWNACQKALKEGEKQGTNRWAQVVDLVRYEAIYRTGGVYLDSNFQINSRSFFEVLGKSSKNFVTANEDPCGLNCQGNRGKKYISNGFFASNPRNEILKKLISQKMLDQIDFTSPYVNRETGPYYFRKGIEGLEKSIKVLPTEKIYPFMVNDSEYRSGQPNKCLSKTDGKDKVKVNDNTYLMKDCNKMYPNSLLIYQSGLGGSWSW